MKEKIVIDATGGIMGRIASFAAKKALLGSEIAIVNCNDVLLTGQKVTTLAKYQKLRKMGGSALKGPNFPRSPEKIVKRTVRGMLPWRQGRGREALKRVKCYNTLPAEYEKVDKVSLKRELKVKATKLKEISRLM